MCVCSKGNRCERAALANTYVQRELKHLLREWLGTKRDRCYELIAHDLCLFYLIILLRLVNCVGAFRGCGIDLCVLVCV